MKANNLYRLGLGASTITAIGMIATGLAHAGCLNESTTPGNTPDTALLWAIGIFAITSIAGICLYTARKIAGLIICSGIMLMTAIGVLFTTFFVAAVGQPSLSEILPMVLLTVALLLMVGVIMRQKVRTMFCGSSKWSLTGIIMASAGTAIALGIAMLAPIV